MLVIFEMLDTSLVDSTLQILSGPEAYAASHTAFSAIIDVAYKIAMVLVASFNIFYVIRLNKLQNQDKETQRKSELRMDLLKTLVYAPNLNKMYVFLDHLWTELIKLRLEDEEQKSSEKEEMVKKNIEPKIQSLFTSFRSDFIIILNATAPSLGKKVETICDDMRDAILANMADPGINLWVNDYFTDRIKVIFEKGKMDMVSALFNYEGKE